MKQCKECGTEGCVPKESFYLGVGTGNGPFCSMKCLESFRARNYPRPPTPEHVQHQRIDGGGAYAF